jgi:plastocyanin
LLIPPSVRAQQWQATVGAQSQDKGRQAQAFLPNEIWVHKDDTVTWHFDSDAVHTVTFLAVGQTRVQNMMGCGMPTPTTSDGTPFDGSSCVNGGRMTNGNSYSVTFPQVGDFKLVCLVHPNMTGVVHVLDPSLPLPHNQDFYDDEAADQRRALLADRDGEEDHDRDAFRHHFRHHRNQVATGVGEIVATAAGFQTLSVMRFMEPTQVIHVGETVEWNNDDPVEPHTITFGPEPQNLMAASANVKIGLDGARNAVINSTSDVVHSGFIVAPPQERIGLVQIPLPPLPGSTVTRFRVTFTSPGTFPYICALHDDFGMKGRVLVLP